MTSMRGAAALLASTCALLVACTSSDPAEVAHPSDSPPFEFASATAALAESGDLVVLASEPVEALDSEHQTPFQSSRARGAAIRHDDGTWSSLPDPPPLVAPDLIEVGDTVAVVGVTCDGPPCGKGLKTGALLSDDLDQWDSFVFDDETVDAGNDGGMGRAGPGWASGGRGYWAIGPLGALAFATYPSVDLVNATRFNCPIGRKLASVGMQVPEFDVGKPPPALPSQRLLDALVFDAEDPDGGWAPGPPPPLTILEHPLSVCGRDEVLFIDTDTEVRWSIDRDEWTERPITLPIERTIRDTGRSWALDDGTVILQGTSGQGLVVRYPDGRYEATDIVVNDLFVTGDLAYELVPAPDAELRGGQDYLAADLAPIDLGS